MGGLPGFRAWLSEVDDVEVHVLAADRKLRKQVLRQYRLSVLIPAMDDYDNAAFQGVVSDEGWPYPTFNPHPAKLPSDLLLAFWNAEQWRSYHLWSVTRVTGRMPLALCGVDMMPRVLAYCPCRLQPDADLQHVFCACPDHRLLHEDSGMPSGSWDIVMLWLFDGWDICNAEGGVHARIHYVAETMRAIAAALLVEAAFASNPGSQTG